MHPCGYHPRKYYPEIAANDAQREEWVKQHAIDMIKGDGTKPGYSKPLKTRFLKDLTIIAEKRILGVTNTAIAPWIVELSKKHIKADGEEADYNRLLAHLNRYTARNTFDYFIHKDLGVFLHRELDFYIKNEVMHLDDVENETSPRVEQYLSKIKVIRKIAGKIIDF